MTVPGILVCSIFLISVCIFNVSKALFISSATVIVRPGEVNWLNLFMVFQINVRVKPVIPVCILVYLP